MRKVTPRQRAFLLQLMQERTCPQDAGDRLMKQLRISEDPEEIGMTSDRASEAISWLMKQPKMVMQLDGTPAKLTPPREPGVFEVPDRGIFIVRENRAHTHMYAKKLVEISAQRSNEAGGRVQIEFEYDKGAMRFIGEEHRMPFDRAKELTIRYGRCINCGHRLKAAKSVEEGIGPVCRKRFR